ncbi:phosphoribosylformylglycinamidine synthase [Candidatus Epulonipiscioides gigas]|nr:phosphoribosylformylglycinamidine synthase [Epulopiscium sp. SCG-C07WGA-EpuloA2]
MAIFRLYVEKKTGIDIVAESIKQELKHFLHIENVEDVRVFNRYDVENIKKEVYEKAKVTIFSEPQTDIIYETLPHLEGFFVFATSFLNGQYDQRADSCEQCISLLDSSEKSFVKTATVYCISGNITEADKEKIQNHLINKVEKELVSLDELTTLKINHPIPKNVAILDGFISLSNEEISKFRDNNGLAMSADDLIYFRDYFKSENRDPSFTELKVVDTYWSDHCRHTTFMTEISDIEVEECEANTPIMEALKLYYKLRRNCSKKVCLMNLATIIVPYLKKDGKLSHLVESDEINACTIEDIIEIDGKKEEYLILFKNETHNHPTEIEPFGGAATCLGGAIRDPLSGRAYVYQAMRITGSGNPTEKIDQTIKGKLPQRQITTVAANGYSSYGNQIGLATGEVKEYYHDGYKAKRLEVGAVVGAVPKANVKREEPTKGDVILLIGGATGRDGCGGATGSSKEHTKESIKLCGSEVQKGNPVEERKLQRLFRNPQFTQCIKRCNDFGAGGVCVAIGEIAQSLVINLDNVLVKYTGLDGTELAISESQERMAIAVEQKDVELCLNLCEKENLNATIVANVTDDNRLVMTWRGEKIVDISRDFLDSAGVKNIVKAHIAPANIIKQSEVSKDDIEKMFASLNASSQKPLTSQFDNTIGKCTVLMPYGGRYQLTKEIGMVSKIPVLKGSTDHATYMTHGFSPTLSEQSPFHGAIYAIIESIAKQIALGANFDKIYLSFQEYFERLGNTPSTWGKPVATLLGALVAQKNLEIGAIGGKDSMSGTFGELTVPPTFISFACSVGLASNCISGSFKEKNSKILYLHIPRDKYDMPDFNYLKKAYKLLEGYIKDGLIKSSYTIGYGGISYALSQMCIGNKIGCSVRATDPLTQYYGDILLEVTDKSQTTKIDTNIFIPIGTTNETSILKINEFEFELEKIINTTNSTLDKVFTSFDNKDATQVPIKLYESKNIYMAQNKVVHPKVLIPVFPGTNCEYDMQKSFEKAGAKVEQLVFLNRNSLQIEESTKVLAKAIKEANILAFSGGFSAGDEPDGSGKFIATVFRNELIKEAIEYQLEKNDGLIIGICNGFQVLIKLGLLPDGQITTMTDNSPTLTFNTLGKHISTVANTMITSNKSPWLNKVKVGECYSIPISHGEGRFVANIKTLDKLLENGQIFSQYVDINGNPLKEASPNGSLYNIEGIVSNNGRILGKMGHSERFETNILKNIYGNKDQKLFEAGVEYFN